MELDEFKIMEWLENIVDEEKFYLDLCDETEYDNMYYLPSFVDSLRHLLPKLPP